MDLNNMIIPSKSTWVEYPGIDGFEVELVHLTRDELMKIRKKAMNTKLNRRTRAMEDELDSDLFQTLWVGSVIKDWKGLKLKYLDKFMPTDTSGFDAEDELEYSKNNAEALIKNASGFDDWVSSILDDIENFTQSSSS